MDRITGVLSETYQRITKAPGLTSWGFLFWTVAHLGAGLSSYNMLQKKRAIICQYVSKKRIIGEYCGIYIRKNWLSPMRTHLKNGTRKNAFIHPGAWNGRAFLWLCVVGGVPTGANFSAYKERRNPEDGRHRRTSRLWIASLRRAWAGAEIWTGLPPS